MVGALLDAGGNARRRRLAMVRRRTRDTLLGRRGTVRRRRGSVHSGFGWIAVVRGGETYDRTPAPLPSTAALLGNVAAAGPVLVPLRPLHKRVRCHHSLWSLLPDAV